MTGHDQDTRSGIAAVRAYERLMESAGVLALATVVVVMTAQVFSRYILNTSIIWAEELCRYILIWMTFLFAGIAFQRGQFIALDYTTALLPATARFVLKIIVSLPILFFLGVISVYGYLFANRMYAQTLPAIDFIARDLGLGPAPVSIFWLYISVTVGCVLLFIHILAAVVLEGLQLRNGTSQSRSDLL